jgi:predicted transposase/invertase (TIGR01784 family)
MKEDDKNGSDKQESGEKPDKKKLGTFINLRTDFGFKRVFYHPAMMMSFSNEVISRREKDFHITSISFLPVEQLGEYENEHRVIVDSRCKTDKGEDIVVEMQNARPANFVERSIYYYSYLVRNQLPVRKTRGKKNKNQLPQLPADYYYAMKAVYFIAIVNFPMVKESETTKNTVIDWIRLVSLETSLTYSEKVNVIIVDLTKFNKTHEELTTLLDFWLYTLKYAETLKERPAEIKDELFIDLYDNILRTNKLTPEEMEAYNNSVISLNNIGLFTEHSKMEGREEGREKGKMEAYTEIVFNAIDKGFSIGDISALTGISIKQVYDILKNRRQIN